MLGDENIEVEVKDVYGKQTIYPVGEKAHIFAKMLGTKTLTKDALGHIKELGYKIVVKTKTIEV